MTDGWPNSSDDERVERHQQTRSWLELAKRTQAAETTTVSVVEAGERQELDVTRHGIGPIKNDHGREFFVFNFSVSDRWAKYVVVVDAALDSDFRPRFDASQTVKLRVDSGCMTGQILHDETCECRQQMHAALERIAEHGQGLLISIPEQDGRGRGVPFKLATLTLQKELGVDTLTASALLDPVGNRDERTYAGAVAILKALGVSADLDLVLLSNNVDKQRIFLDNGFQMQLEHLSVEHHEAAKVNMRAKRDYLGHKGLDPDG